MHGTDDSAKLTHHSELIRTWLADRFRDCEVDHVDPEPEVRLFRAKSDTPPSLRLLRFDRPNLEDSWDDGELISELGRLRVADRMLAAAGEGGVVSVWYDGEGWVCREVYDD